MKKFIDKLAYIYIVDHKILMSLSTGKDTWYIPGGKRDGDETDLQALTREVEEELSVKLLKETIKKYGVFEAQAHGHPEGVLVRMTCYTSEFDGELLPSSEIEKLEFFHYSRKAESSPVDHIIFDIPNFSSDSIQEIRFMIGNKKAENFRLEIDKIELE